MDYFFVVLLGLAVGAYVYSSRERGHTSSAGWISRPLDNIRSAHIQIKDESYTLARKDDGLWEASVPGPSWNVSALAKNGRIKDYLARFSVVAPHRTIGGFDQGGLEEYGLDQPALKVILSFLGKEEETLTVRFSIDPDGRVFGWNSDNPALVYEFDRQTLADLSIPAIQFLDTRVFRFEEDLVSSIQLVQPFGSSWLVERKKGAYLFSLPGYLKEKSASASQVKLYVNALMLLRAEKMIFEPVLPEKDVPALTIKVGFESDQEPQQVEFFAIANDPEMYLGRSTWLRVPFLLDADSVSQLMRSAFDIQDRKIFSLEFGTVSRIVIDHGSRSYEVERGDGGWHARGEEKVVPGIDMLLWRITELQFEALPLNNLPESAVRLMQCRLLDEDGDLLKSLLFYADPKLPRGQCWMRDGEGMYYPVSSRLLNDLQGMFPSGSKGNS